MSDEKYILVVDDDQTTLTMLGYYLKSIGVPYLTASDGESALQILQDQAEEICLVLLDLAMPHMDGYEVCRAIRAELQLADLPVIAVTALNGPHIHGLAVDAGFDDTISKPFEPKSLRDLLEDLGLLP